MDLSHATLTKPNNIFFKKKEDGTIILANAEDDDPSILELEGISGEIWEKLVQGITYLELLKWMLETYEGEESEIENDLNEFLLDLITKNFVNVSP